MQYSIFRITQHTLHFTPWHTCSIPTSLESILPCWKECTQTIRKYYIHWCLSKPGTHSYSWV